MKKEKVLTEVADIRFGLNAKASENGQVILLQGKDFNEQGQLERSNLYKIEEGVARDGDFLRPGEVLFAGKGSRNYALVWDGKINPAVASSTFFRLKIQNGSVLPEYLAWFLNSRSAQDYFKKNLRTTTIFTISKKVLEKLPVLMPSFEVQQKIARINKLQHKERLLLGRWIDNKEKYIDNALDQLLKE